MSSGNLSLQPVCGVLFSVTLRVVRRDARARHPAKLSSWGYDEEYDPDDYQAEATEYRKRLPLVL